MTEEQKQKLRENNKKCNEIKKECRRFSNITDKQKQKRRDYQKQYRENMTEEQGKKEEIIKENIIKSIMQQKKLNNKNENIIKS